MGEVLQLTISSLGLRSLVDGWKPDHNTLEQNIWPFEDIVKKVVALAHASLSTYEDYRLGKLNAAPPFGYFVDRVRENVQLIQLVIAIGEGLRNEMRFEVDGLSVLRAVLPQLQAIIDEDELATNSAFSCGCY